jgi:D-glycero-D-manno-heptose 1,7-bisphosphate phosphatase
MCKCRKPKPGNILDCARENNIDLSKSFMVGDAASDIEAGRNAGCKTVAVYSGYIDAEEIKCFPVKPDLVFEDVYRFAINLKNETELDTYSE